MENDSLIEASVLKIGKVFSVEGRTIKIIVDKQKNTSNLFYQGKVIKNVGVGGYIKIAKGFIRIICKVDGEYVKENKYFFDKEYKKKDDIFDRILEVKLLGYFEGKIFKRGIKELPLLGNECFLLNKEEFIAVHYFVDDQKDRPFRIGRLSLERSQEVKVGVNSLFASHIGIFGNTGSGKSYTLARLYRELLLIYKKSENFNKFAHFLLIDFNGEYARNNIITDSKKTFNLSTKTETGGDKLPINEQDFSNLDLLSILGNATDKTQKPFLKRTLSFYESVMNSDTPLEYFHNVLRKRITNILRMADKNKAFLLLDYMKAILPILGDEQDLIDDIEWNNTHSEFMLRAFSSVYLASNPERIPGTRIYKHADNYRFKEDFLSNIIDFLYLQLIYDVINNRAQNEHIAPVINKLISSKKDIKKLISSPAEHISLWRDTNFVVVNLNDINLEMKKIVPLLLSKKIYDEQKELRKDNDSYFLNIIIDEAHNILSSQSFREAETWKDYRLETFEEIVKEGRKFGVFLTVASQRPADISSTIISQLHNFFLHRLINENDIQAVERNISYLDKTSFEYLSILPTGTCIFGGVASNVPIIVDIDSIEEGCEPDNKTVDLVKIWAG